VNAVHVRDALFALVPPDDGSDWSDVLQRAYRRRRSRGRRLAFVFAVALLVTLAVGSALALSGRLGNLFHGTPVNDLTPRERFLMTELDLNGKVELIARRNGSAFYVIRGKDGRVCYSIGDARTNLTPAQREGQFRLGGAECPDPRVFPSRAMPVLNRSFFSYRRGDREYRMGGVQGFAADAVAGIGVIGRDNRIIFTLQVRHNVYTAGKRAFAGARGVVALADDGNVLWVQCLAIGPSVAPQFPGGGCGKYKNTPYPKLPPRKTPRSPIEAPGPLVVQHGSGDGVTVDIRGSRITANLAGLSPEKRALFASKSGRFSLGCFKLVTVGGQTNESGVRVTKPFTAIVRMRPYDPLGRTQRPPFDACTAMGLFGHTWGNAYGTHDTVEIALTRRGRVYLTERAVARDLAWLTRARVFRAIRYGLRPFTSAAAARWLGSHAVPLEGASSTPELGKLGIWIGPERRIVLAERTAIGRRLYAEIRRGILYRTNLFDLARPW
jgi:hypothetical protein